MHLEVGNWIMFNYEDEFWKNNNKYERLIGEIINKSDSSERFTVSFIDEIVTFSNRSLIFNYRKATDTEISKEKLRRIFIK